MADEKGQKREVQYRVTLLSGNDKRLTHYIWASKEQINEARNRIETQNDVDFCPVPENESGDESNLLEICAINEENANHFAEVLGLPKPFTKYKEGYTLNPRGDFN